MKRAVVLLLLVGCSRGQPALTEEDKAGEVFTEGAKVKAPLGKRKKEPATVVEVYGKVAKLKYSSHNIGWALLKDLEPQGAVSLYPEGDSCDAKVGDRVRARWSTALTLTGGEVDEVHGKLAHIKFDDGDVDWSWCSELKPPLEASDDDEAGGGDDGASAEVTHCKRGCNSSCRGAKNKSKCVGQCRRACEH